MKSMLNTKRGQEAFTYLSTYGWAILIFLAMIAGFIYFGVLDPNRFLPAKCELPAGFSCTDFRISSTSGIDIVLRNSLGYDINSIVVRVGGCTSDFDTNPIGQDSLKNKVQNTWSNTAIDCGINNQGGRTFRKEFGIDYTNINTGLAHTVNGSIRARVE